MIALFSRIKNEINLNEWMTYHYQIGFDFILLYDDYDAPTTSIKHQISGNIDKSKYLIIDKIFIEETSEKMAFLNSESFYSTILKYIRDVNAKYLVHFDCDEYLCLKKFKNVGELIKFYEPFDHLFLNWLFFGTRFRDFTGNTYLDKFQYSNMKLSPFGKSIVLVDSVLTSCSPHWWKMKKNSLYKNIYNQSFDNREDSMPHPNVKKIIDLQVKDELPCYVAHIYFVGITQAIKRRFSHNNSVYIMQLSKNHLQVYNAYCQLYKTNETLLINIIADKDDAAFSNLITSTVEDVAIRAELLIVLRAIITLLHDSQYGNDKSLALYNTDFEWFVQLRSKVGEYSKF